MKKNDYRVKANKKLAWEQTLKHKSKVHTPKPKKKKKEKKKIKHWEVEDYD